jgi:redox-regulated HSP33 family molecular chaperone
LVGTEPDASKTVLSAAASGAAQEKPMKKLMMLAAAASLAATMANAQNTTVTTTGAGSAAVQIEPQYRTRIKGYITEHKVRPVETREKIIVGAKVPSDVELATVPSDWGPSLTKYRYVYSGDRVMLVDPGTRTVVQEVD